jgi:type IV pilus assembly protein PilN
MIHINLLPYREEKRKAKRQQFYGLFGLVSILGCLIVFGGYTVIDGQLSAQQSRNEFIRREVALIDKQIDEIRHLREQAQAMLARKRIIESLQQDRAEAVLLLSELVKQMPEGVYLNSMRQDGQRIALAGIAQSSPRVSTLMRNIEASEWLENPQLMEIKAVILEGRRLSEFNMTVAVKRMLNQEADK